MSAVPIGGAPGTAARPDSKQMEGLELSLGPESGLRLQDLLETARILRDKDRPALPQNCPVLECRLAALLRQLFARRPIRQPRSTGSRDTSSQYWRRAWPSWESLATNTR